MSARPVYSLRLSREDRERFERAARRLFWWKADPLSAFFRFAASDLERRLYNPADTAWLMVAQERTGAQLVLTTLKEPLQLACGECFEGLPITADCPVHDVKPLRSRSAR